MYEKPEIFPIAEAAVSKGAAAKGAAAKGATVKVADTDVEGAVAEVKEVDENWEIAPASEDHVKADGPIIN